MNWACILEAIMCYVACTQGKTQAQAQDKTTDCLKQAAIAALPTFIDTLFACLTADGGGGGGGETGYKPGTRNRCS